MSAEKLTDKENLIVAIAGNSSVDCKGIVKIIVELSEDKKVYEYEVDLDKKPPEILTELLIDTNSQKQIIIADYYIKRTTDLDHILINEINSSLTAIETPKVTGVKNKVSNPNTIRKGKFARDMNRLNRSIVKRMNMDRTKRHR